MGDAHRRPRILYLDGLRCVAIAGVLLFHYFTRWAPPWHFESLYPYGNTFSSLCFYGAFGVQLFFIVSGFVIALTLYRCSNAFEFTVRRFARLWPSMLLCSVTTLLLVRVIPNHSFRVSFSGLIPSLTFIDPDLLNRFFHTRMKWIDGAYWSLFVEVRFYFLAAVLFFLRRSRFPDTMYQFSRVVLALSLLASLFHIERLYGLLELFFITRYLPWFLIGTGFYLLENDIEERTRNGLFIVGIATLWAQAVIDRSFSEWIVGIVIPLLFLISSRVAIVNRILSLKLLTGIGATSYSLYLLHENAGTAFIGWLGKITNLSGPYSAVLALITAVLVAVVAKLIYDFWETPLNRLIVAPFSRPKAVVSERTQEGSRLATSAGD